MDHKYKMEEVQERGYCIMLWSYDLYSMDVQKCENIQVTECNTTFMFQQIEEIFKRDYV